MSDLTKTAQIPVVIDQSVLSQFQPHNADDGAGEIILTLEEPDAAEQEIIFTLPEVPGAENAEPIVIEPDDVDSEISVMEQEDVAVEEPDHWDWQSSHGLGGFLEWLHGMMNNVPKHTGKTAGVERALSYFEALDKEISRAMRVDYKDEIKAAKAEEARDEIHKAIDRLTDRLESLKGTRSKKKKKADVEGGLVKEAGTERINGISITVPLFVSAMCRIIVNGSVSGGHDPTDMYKKLDKKYKFSPRDKVEIIQLLADMNMPLRLDRGLIDEEVDVTSSNNFDWSAQRYS